MLNEEDFNDAKKSFIKLIGFGKKLHSVLVVDKKSKTTLARGISISDTVNESLLKAICPIIIKGKNSIFIPVAIREQSIYDYIINRFYNLFKKKDNNYYFEDEMAAKFLEKVEGEESFAFGLVLGMNNFQVFVIYFWKLYLFVLLKAVRIILWIISIIMFPFFKTIKNVKEKQEDENDGDERRMLLKKVESFTYQEYLNNKDRNYIQFWFKPLMIID